MGRQGFPQRRGRCARRERFAAAPGGQGDLSDRQEGQGQNRQNQLHRQRPVPRQAPAPHVQEDPSEVHQLPAQHQAQRKRFRGGQGAAHRLLQRPRLPQRHHRARFGLPHRQQAAGHRHRTLGGQQILYPQRLVGRQFGLRNR